MTKTETIQKLKAQIQRIADASLELKQMAAEQNFDKMTDDDAKELLSDSVISANALEDLTNNLAACLPELNPGYRDIAKI